LEHERAYLRYVGSLGFAVSDLREIASETQAVTGTAALMKQGVDLISHGALGEGRWFGRPDVLRKTAQPSGLGPWSYEVYDCKLALVTKGATVLRRKGKAKSQDRLVRLARVRCGIASNLYELGADEKIVQRVLRHAKSHVTKDRYIKAFDPAVVAAMKKLEATVDLMNQSAPNLVGQLW